MPGRCLLCYITDRNAFPGDEPLRRRALLGKVGEATRSGVDYIQLREKDLSGRELEALAREVMHVIREVKKLATGNRQPATVFLVNSRVDVALSAGADGVHLRSDDISLPDARRVWSCGADTLVRENSPGNSTIAVSCHSPAEVVQAEAQGASFAVLAPVFEKKNANPAGLTVLKEACRAKIPVLALGGVTLENAASCLDAGAAGVAAIRLFQENDVAEVVERLRG
jgi:thiamine-phosphate pyrophosphorylase